VLGYAAQPVAGGGYQVDTAGGADNPIVVPPGSTDVTIGGDGNVSYVTPAGVPGTGNYGQTITGRLEQSNVDMGAEFINMVEAERGYQANSGTITTAERMLQATVQMKR
jgi:flagellar hook protein FlgE